MRAIGPALLALLTLAACQDRETPVAPGPESGPRASTTAAGTLPGAERRITNDGSPPADQFVPAVSGTRIVWEDYRNGNADVYLYDLSTNTERRITSDPATQGYPHIDGNLVVWQDERNGNADVYLYDLSTNTERRITTDPVAQYTPRIDGSRIVWSDGNGDIYLYDLSTGTQRRITSDPALQQSPAIDGNRIVWLDRRHGNSEVYLFDLATGTERRITNSFSNKYAPTVSGNRIAWMDFWRQTVYDPATDLYVHDLGTGTRHRITDDPAPQSNPAVDGRRIVWVDEREGDRDIFMFEAAPPPNRAPTANPGGPYSAGEGSGIAFNGSGSTDPDADSLTYRWSFGDGTSSTLKNPTKAYRDNGTYTVTLTVTDPAGLVHAASTTATISNVAPTASLSAPTSISEGSGYTLRISGSDAGTADRATLQFWLDCGRGAGYQAAGTTRTLTCPVVPDQDTITVRGKVRDKDGAESEHTRTVRVNNAAPVVSFSATSATTIPVGGSVGVQGSFTDAGLADAPWSWTIYWGDGSPRPTGTTSSQGSLPPASHTYTRAGTWTAYLTVTDKDGRVGKSNTVTVTP